MSLNDTAKDLLDPSLDQERLIQTEVEKQDAREEAARRRRARNAKPLELLTEEEFNQQPPSDFLVHGLIVVASLIMLVGAPGTLKTFLALDLCARIAAGHAMWLGRKLTRKGSVVYVLGEGRGRFAYRLRLWRQVNKVTGPLPIHIVPCPLDLRSSDQIQALIERITPLAPVLVVFDTLNRNMPGAEENSAKDMGEAVAAAGRIQESTGATVLTLHHPTKDGVSSRGSGAGKGAVDAELWVKKLSNLLYELSVGKAKDADDELTITFCKHVVELDGVVENGEPVTSVVLQLATAQQVKAAANLQGAILAFVHANPLANTGAIKKAMGGKGQNLTNTLDVMEKRGALTFTLKGSSKQWEVTALGLMELNQP
jgi:putative DNA primase/helicase